MEGNGPAWPPEPGRPMSPWAIRIGGVLVVLLGVVAVGALYYFYGGGTGQDRAGLDLVRTAGTLVAGLGGLFALLLAARRQRSTEQTLVHQYVTLEHQREVAVIAARDAAEQRITELYTRAVDQLGNDQAPVRLGGLHALERLADTNPAQQQTIVDVLCAYLRMPYTPPDDQPPDEDAPAEEHTRYEQRRQELQVRLTAQRILAAHLRPEAAEVFWTDISLDLTGAHLHELRLAHCRVKSAQFSGAHFSVDAWFEGVQFDGPARFEGAQFGGSVLFNGAQFGGFVSFGGAQFGGDTSFDDARFSRVASFDGAQFSVDVSFADAWFSEAAWFAKVQFGGDAWFNGVQFSSDGLFDGAQFDRGAFFGGVQSGVDSWVDEAQFSGAALFRGTQFSGVAWFDGAQFRAAWFDKARARPDLNYSWPAGWTIREPRLAEGEEEGWMYLVRVEAPIQ